MFSCPLPPARSCRHWVAFAVCSHASFCHTLVRGARVTRGLPMYSQIRAAELAAQAYDGPQCHRLHCGFLSLPSP